MRSKGGAVGGNCANIATTAPSMCSATHSIARTQAAPCGPREASSPWTISTRPLGEIMRASSAISIAGCVPLTLGGRPFRASRAAATAQGAETPGAALAASRAAARPSASSRSGMDAPHHNGQRLCATLASAAKTLSTSASAEGQGRRTSDSARLPAGAGSILSSAARNAAVSKPPSARIEPRGASSTNAAISASLGATSPDPRSRKYEDNSGFVFPQRRLAAPQSDQPIALPISPTMPRRNSSTQATKIAPWMTVTHSPKPAR